MNPATWKEAKTLFAATKKVADESKAMIIVAPPALYLREITSSYKGKRIKFALQNGHYDAVGSHTGDVSLAQGKDAKAAYAIIGHAERRAAGETNDDTRRKVSAAIALGMTPILCVGESSRSPNGEHFRFVAEELRTGLADVPPQKIGSVLIAYEPIWAIGATKPMNPRDMHEMAIFIRKSIQESGKNGLGIPVLYGGSIDETNARDMLDNGDVGGLLVGRASANPFKMKALIESLE